MLPRAVMTMPIMEVVKPQDKILALLKLTHKISPSEFPFEDMTLSLFWFRSVSFNDDFQ